MGEEKTQFDAVESITHLLIVVYEWMKGDWYTHVSACVCIYIYCLIGNNGRLQYLRFCLLKCMSVVFVMSVQCNENRLENRAL